MALYLAKQESTKATPVRMWGFTITPRFTAAAITAAAVLGIAGYFGYRLLPAFQNPLLIIEQPAADVVVANPEFIVTGRTDGRRLTLNHEEVYLAKDGNFRQSVYLASGLNVLEFTAESRFGRKTRMTRYIIFRP